MEQVVKTNTAASWPNNRPHFHRHQVAPKMNLRNRCIWPGGEEEGCCSVTSVPVEINHKLLRFKTICFNSAV